MISKNLKKINKGKKMEKSQWWNSNSVKFLLEMK